MTLLSIVQDAADEIGVEQPASVAGNADPLAQKFFRLVNKCGKSLMKEAKEMESMPKKRKKKKGKKR